MGDIVIVCNSETTVRKSVNDSGYIWNDQMIGMLGEEFPILDILDNDIVTLPSLDGSQDGKWYFHRSVLRKAVHQR